MRLQKGYAAHYKYKNGATQEGGLDVWLNLLKEALENSQTSAVDFVEDFKMNLYSKEIYVFTQEILTYQKEQLHWTSPLAYIQK
jgi:(p)ppGpp synthase/HD superfamily hydrolase